MLFRFAPRFLLRLFLLLLICSLSARFRFRSDRVDLRGSGLYNEVDGELCDGEFRILGEIGTGTIFFFLAFFWGVFLTAGTFFDFGLDLGISMLNLDELGFVTAGLLDNFGLVGVPWIKGFRPSEESFTLLGLVTDTRDFLTVVGLVTLVGVILKLLLSGGMYGGTSEMNFFIGRGYLLTVTFEDPTFPAFTCAGFSVKLSSGSGFGLPEK